MSKNRKHNEKVEKRIEEQEVIPDEKVAEKTSGKPEEERAMRMRKRLPMKITNWRN